ncbi:MAG: crotonyl-CoA carboxylase/reductase [Nitrospirae bacterium]|nr:crotonyl-CoA carboxylase/reductase [Nitrospirota bacterium]
MAGKEIFEVADLPPLGVVPGEMYAQVIRAARFGEPKTAFQLERIPIRPLKEDEVLVYVMAAGINYNNVWAARGIPVDVIKARQKQGDPYDFHIGGSDASGIVWAVGSGVRNVKVGDHVVVHCGVWDRKDPFIVKGGDPMFSSTQLIWGYETNWGSFAQYTIVQDHQCLPKPKQLTWEAAAAYMLVGATAYRMLKGWPPQTVQKGDVVLIWGGAGGLGSMAIQIVKAFGGIPVAVVSSDDKAEFCKKLGAKGVINRRNFNHWGMLPHWKDEKSYGEWLQGARAFGKALWDGVGERKNPRIVFDHPGEDTVPTSIFVCDTGGMVVICAGTSGYNAVADLRYLWMRQKRFQGSHFANDEQCAALNHMVAQGMVGPCLSRTFKFDEIPLAHQLMHENKHPSGNMAALVGSPKPGLTDLP